MPDIVKPNTTDMIKTLQEIENKYGNASIFVKNGAALLMLTGVEIHNCEAGVAIRIHADLPRKVH